MPSPTSGTRGRAPWLWIGVGNLVVGAAVALAPGMSGDLLSIRGWLDAWLGHGASPYARPELLPNWPPYVLVPLAPLFVVPASLLPAVWLPLNIAATVAACRYLACAFTTTADDASVAFWMLLSFGAVRSGLWHGQLTMAALVVGWWAVTRRASPGAGLLLALSMVKPLVALPFVARLAFTRRVMTLLVCAVALAASWGIFAGTVNESIAVSVTSYRDALQVYVGEDFRRSASDVRTLASRVLPWPASDAVAAATAVACAVLILVGMRRGRARPDIGLRVFALVALWSLLTFPQQRYSLILSAPALLMLGLHLRAAGHGLRLIHWALVLEIDWILGRVLPALDPRLEILFPLVNLPAVLVLLLFAWLIRDTWSDARDRRA